MAAAIISELQVKGKYGKYGGQYVPEVLMPALEELEEGYERYKNDPEFLAELDHYLMDFAGRETLLSCPEPQQEIRDKDLLKREDLVHGGAHKLNNARAAFEYMENQADCRNRSRTARDCNCNGRGKPGV